MWNFLALLMYLVLMVSRPNCSAERSFSKMKLIKNRLSTSMGNEQLSHLALMSIQVDILREINFEDLVTEFVKKKTRKVPRTFRLPTFRPQSYLILSH